jgi:hypothetical protein
VVCRVEKQSTISWARHGNPSTRTSLSVFNRVRSDTELQRSRPRYQIIKRPELPGSVARIQFRIEFSRLDIYEQRQLLSELVVVFATFPVAAIQPSLLSRAVLPTTE